MRSKIRQLRSALEQKRGEADFIKKQIDKKSKDLRIAQRSFRQNEKAQIVVQEVVRITQEKLQYHLSDISSAAMSSIFPDPYSVEFDFIPKRGKIEADIWFCKNGNQTHPYSTGGGAIDITSLSLRFSCWTLYNPKTRPILILDEPLKFVSKHYIKNAADLISQISKRLGIQILMVSHNTNLIDSADKIITVNINNGKSFLEV